MEDEIMQGRKPFNQDEPEEWIMVTGTINKKQQTPQQAAEECALKEGIDPNFDLDDLPGSCCPHGKPYSFKRIFLAGAAWAIQQRELNERGSAHDFVERIRKEDKKSFNIAHSERFYVGLWHGYKAALGEFAKPTAINIYNALKEAAIEISHLEVDRAEQEKNNPGVCIDYMPIGRVPVITLSTLYQALKQIFPEAPGKV